MGHLVDADSILLVRGVIDRRGGEEANLIVNELIPLDQLDSRYTTGIVVRIHEDATTAPDTLDKVREVVRSYPGNSELQLAADPRRRQPRLPQERTARGWKSPASCGDRLDDLLGPGNLQLITTPPKPAANNGNGRRQFRAAEGRVGCDAGRRQGLRRWRLVRAGVRGWETAWPLDRVLPLGK